MKRHININVKEEKCVCECTGNECCGCVENCDGDVRGLYLGDVVPEDELIDIEDDEPIDVEYVEGEDVAGPVTFDRDMGNIVFEDDTLPFPDELNDGYIYTKEDGTQMLYVKVTPKYGSTYLGRLMNNAELGKVKYVHGSGHGVIEEVLSENAFLETFDTTPIISTSEDGCMSSTIDNHTIKLYLRIILAQ